MTPEDRRKLGLLIFILLPVLFWFEVVRRTEVLPPKKGPALWELMKQTPDKPILIMALVGGIVVAILLIWLMNELGKSDFGGAPFKRFLRGTKLVSKDKLKRMTREKKVEQVTVGGIPIPTKVENLHIAIQGSTGGGKSVAIRELLFSALLRGDRVIVVDPNGDLYSKFGRDGDVVLNPYDARTQGWSFFNEIRNDYDFKRYALSVVQRGKTHDEEEWRGYGRLLLTETARKLTLMGKPSVQDLFRWTTIAAPKDLKLFLEGTLAESLFVGAEKALASARFVLSTTLPEHVTMPPGDFSLRRWLEDPKGGNLYITWREDMVEALRPLVSAWVDVLCTSILSLPEDRNRRLWAFFDELPSLEKLPSLIDAVMKGRKMGLRLVTAFQSTAQLDDIYGKDEAQILRSCFRSLVVLGGAKTDPKTCEDMSQALGEHEVERDKYSRNSSSKGSSTNRSPERNRERVVMPSEIASLPELTGYVALAGSFPISRIKLEWVDFTNRLPAFEERRFGHA